MKKLFIILILFLFACGKIDNRRLDYIEIVPENVESLVIVLHGYAGDNRSVYFVAESLSKSFPNTAFVLPNAPDKMTRGMGFQWFPLNVPEYIMRREAKKSNKILNNFIKAQLERFSLANENIILAGFSQGGIMSLHNGFRQRKKFSGVISFSGLLSDDVASLKSAIKSKPKVLMINGTRDETVDYSNLAKAVKVFETLDVPYEARTLNGVGHVINYEALEYAREFLEKNITLEN